MRQNERRDENVMRGDKQDKVKNQGKTKVRRRKIRSQSREAIILTLSLNKTVSPRSFALGAIFEGSLERPTVNQCVN
jgi:hypothetical protein